jgi:DNA-binding transcriptional LysR family regulator
VATGWESQLTVAVDGVMSPVPVFELCEAFFALTPGASSDGPGTRLRLRHEVLAGTLEALTSGQADLALGITIGHDVAPPMGVEVQPLAELAFVFAVAPHHPLAAAAEPIGETELLRHRAVAVADSATRLTPLTMNLLPGQDVFTVPSTQAKIEAQLRCLGCGYIPEPLARDHIAAGRLVVKQTFRRPVIARLGYAWRTPQGTMGRALRWWLDQLESPTTRRALVERHGAPRG